MRFEVSSLTPLDLQGLFSGSNWLSIQWALGLARFKRSGDKTWIVIA
jgi:hypothetical protein